LFRVETWEERIAAGRSGTAMKSTRAYRASWLTKIPMIPTIANFEGLRRDRKSLRTRVRRCQRVGLSAGESSSVTVPLGAMRVRRIVNE
jgi:hypothetical protein